MTRLAAPLLCSTLLLAGCGGIGSDSGWNPLGWVGGGGSAPADTLSPKGGYEVVADEQPGIPQILSARFERLGEGQLLVVTGFAPTKGYHDAKLITARPQPAGRISPDADGVLRLRFVVTAPDPEAAAARIPANPQTDTITTAMAMSFVQLAGIKAVEISSASNTITLRR